MNRRHFLHATASLLAAPAILKFTGPARAAVMLTAGHGIPETHNKHVMLLKMAEAVRERTNGRVAMEVHGKASLGSELEMLTKVKSGELDITLNSQGVTSAHVPEVAVLGLPFLFAGPSKAFALVDGPVGRDLDGFFDAAGMVALGYWDNGIRHMTNSKRPIHEPRDVQGLRFRTPRDPMTMDIFQTLGASTTAIAYAETYAALRDRVVDGQENPLNNVVGPKFQEVNAFISLTGHKWECAPLVMSKAARQRLGADFEIVRQAAAEAAAGQRAMSLQAETEASTACRATPGVEILEVDREPFMVATRNVSRLWTSLGHGRFLAKVEVAAA